MLTDVSPSLCRHDVVWHTTPAGVEALDQRVASQAHADGNSATGQYLNPFIADEFAVGVQDPDLRCTEQAEGIVHEGVPDFRMAAAPVGQQLVEEGNRDASPDDSQEQDVYIGLPVFLICPVEDEFAWLCGGKERQNDPGDVGWLDGIPVEEAFHTTDDRGSVRASQEARGEAAG